MAKTSVKSKTKPEPIYVIAGKERSLCTSQCAQLIDKFLEPEQRPLGLFNADPDEVTPATILEELQTIPFLTERRVVVVKNADDFVSKNRELLEGYFDNPSPTGTLILTVKSWPGNTKLAKKLSKVGKLIIIAEPKAFELPRRLIQYAADAHDKKLAPEAAELLVELTGETLGLLYSEIDKLALFAGTEKHIKAHHVESLTGHNRMFNAFAVIDAVTAGNAVDAVTRLRNMFARDKSAEFTVVGAFAFQLRRMFNAKVLLEKGLGPAAVASKLRIWGNKNAFFAQLRKMGLKQIGSTLERLAEIDYEIKTGRTKARVAIERLVLKLATMKR